LLFASFQADIERQFLPIQRRLAEVDLLNEWTTPIGSTVWAIPPGIKEGEYIGQSLFES
ncbi:MAG: Dyp-type peroxidase, partial [Brevibacterium aurantiacum]